ncbi:MAG TPA: energy transducer TonB [Allosphingosinicella sp.]|jgi:TonB family protein
MNNTILLLAGAALLPAAALATQEPQGWTAEALNGRCSVKRSAGSEGTTLSLSRTAGSDVTTLSIVGEGAKRFSWTELAGVELDLDPGGRVAAKAELSPDFIAEHVSLYVRSEERGVLDRFAAARTLRINQSNQVLVEEDIRGVAAAIALLRDCERLALEGAGIDAEQWHSLRSAPRPVVELVKLLKVKDYPKEAVRARASGLVIVRLTVSASGRPTRCDYIARSGHEALDRVTCKIMLERARFLPAIGPDGNTVAAPFVTKINWRAQ